MSKFLFPLISLLGLIVCQSSNAQQTPASDSPEINTNTSPKKECQLPQRTHTTTQKLRTNDHTTFGKIYGVIGDIVMVELEDGTTKHMRVRRSEVGYTRSLIGSRIVCNLSNT